MAGVQSLKEEFLTCAICTDIYTDPCTLGCQHSFCRKCVTDYIKSRPDAVQSKTIPCAFCRQDTRVPNPSRPVEQWAAQFKPSFMIQGLMDRLQTGHKHGDGQDVCFLCEEVGETTPATSWCSDCEVTLCSRCAKRHPKAPSSRNHDVSDLSGGVKVKQRRKVKCKEHEGEQIKFICKDCNTAACQTCCIIKHRACKHVVTIGSMIPEIRSVLTEKRHSLEEKMQENITSVKVEESKIEQLKDKETKTGSQIQCTVENAISLLRKKVKDLMKELGDETGKYIAQHQANVKSGQITTQMYQQHCEFIDQALQSESEMDMYDMYQVCQSGAVDHVGDTAEGWNTSIVWEVNFTPNMEPLRKAITNLGKVNVTVLSGKSPVFRKGQKYGLDTVSTPAFHDTIDITHTEDHDNPDPIDVTVFTENGETTIVVADWINNSLKSVYSKTRKEISRLPLSEKPLRLAKMSGNKVAATVSDSHIVVAKVGPALVLISKLKTSKQYLGITSLPDSTLAVGSILHRGVDIIDLSGKVLRSFTPHNTGLDLIQYPQYLFTTHEGNILVTDWRSDSVYCLTSEGDVVFTYTPTGDRALRDPRGITVTNTGDILLADTESQKIIQLSSDGTFVRDILTSGNEIEKPSGVCVDDTNKVYVCDRGRSACIKVFTFT